MKICLTSVEYTLDANNIPLLHVFGRDEQRLVHLTIKGYKPYFWASEDTVSRLKPSKDYEITDEYGVSLRNIKLVKINVNNPRDIKNIASGVMNFEADIAYPIKYMIDNDILSGIEVPDDAETRVIKVSDVKPINYDYPARYVICDIECDDSNGFPKPNRDPIVNLTCYDSYSKQYTTFYLTERPFDIPSPLDNGCFNPHKHVIKIYNTEKEMLKGFIQWIKTTDPDIITGWNFIDFDMDYIVNRLTTLGLNPGQLARVYGRVDKNNVPGRTVFDLLEAYKKLHPTKMESYRLDAIAEAELGENKVRHTETLSDLWKNHPERMIEYNFKDVELCVGINQKNSIIDFFQEVARYVGCPLRSTMNSSHIVDIFVLRKAKGKYILPTRGDSEAEMFEGATVFTPSKGLKTNIAVMDLKALYPMSMMSVNASPETKVTDTNIPDELCNIAPNGVRFLKSPDGLTRELISQLLEERDQKKALRNTFPYDSAEYEKYDMQQNVIKVIMNTYYGVSGYSKFRLYDRDIGSAVTSIGRATIAHTRNFIESKGYTVIYGDTDSCFVQMPETMSVETIIATATKLASDLNESYPEYVKRELNSETSYFSIKFEKLYKRFFQGDAKKRYAGYLIWKEGVEANKLDIAGFELKRSDSSAITKTVQETVFHMILDGRSQQDIQNFVRPIISAYRNGELSLEQIGVPSGLNKDLNEYASNDTRVRGAEYANKYLGTNFKSGSKPKRIYIKRVIDKVKFPEDTDVICFEYPDQIPEGAFQIDYEKMLDRALKKPLSRIFESLDWKWEDFDPNIPKTKTLFDF